MVETLQNNEEENLNSLQGLEIPENIKQEIKNLEDIIGKKLHNKKFGLKVLVKSENGSLKIVPFPILLTYEEINFKRSEPYRLMKYLDGSLGQGEYVYGYYVLTPKWTSIFDKKMEYKKGEKYYDGKTDYINFGQILGSDGDFIESADTLVHFLISGGSGSGKSVLARNILKQLLENKADVLLIEKENDYNGLFSQFKDQFIFYGKISDLTENMLNGINFILLLMAVMNYRMRLIRSMGVSDYLSAYNKDNSIKRLVFLLDEYETFKQGIEQYIGTGFQFAMDYLAKVMRAYGATLIVATQNLNSSVLGGGQFINQFKYFLIGKVKNIASLPGYSFDKAVLDTIVDNESYSFYCPNIKAFVKPPFTPPSNDIVEKKELVPSVLEFFKKGEVQSYFISKFDDICDYFELDNLKDKFQNQEDLFIIMYMLGKFYREFDIMEQGGSPDGFFTSITKNASWKQSGGGEMDDLFENLFFPIVTNKQFHYFSIRNMICEKTKTFKQDLKKFEKEGNSDAYNSTVDLMVETVKKSIPGILVGRL